MSVFQLIQRFAMGKLALEEPAFRSTRFGSGSPARERQGNLLRLIVERARNYPTIKRVLIWGSFVSVKLEPGDLDYSIVVDPRHRIVSIDEADYRFFVPLDAKIHYGVDRGYLVLYEYPRNIMRKLFFFSAKTEIEEYLTQKIEAQEENILEAAAL